MKNRRNKLLKQKKIQRNKSNYEREGIDREQS